MVIDGRDALVGSDRRRVVAAIGRAAGTPKAHVGIRQVAGDDARDSITVEVRIEMLGDVEEARNAEVMLAITEGGLVTDVPRGENAGHDHYVLARQCL